jgi:hypothetical protein
MFTWFQTECHVLAEGGAVTQRVALHTRLKPGKESAYDSTHRQARMAELLDVEDDYSGKDSGLSQVWELP